ncbi:MAG TPA: hypothetical protein VLF68_01065 [Candidatus Saccharimonadales bacterium]|nr:hypothetical protein [Candidatus Saccharimonadales bacterium]
MALVQAVEQPGHLPVAEKTPLAEKPSALQAKDVRRIALSPTQEQLKQLASARAKERAQSQDTEYTGGYEKKDRDWARRLTKRFESAFAAHESLKEDAANARGAARWGDEDEYHRWQQLKGQREQAGEKVNFLAEPFRQAGLALDQSQIPPTLVEKAQTRISETAHAAGEALTKPMKETQARAAGVVENVRSGIEHAHARADAARTEITLSIGQRILSLKNAKEGLLSRLSHARASLGSAVGEGLTQKRQEISDLMDSARVQKDEASQKAVSSIRGLFARAKERVSEKFAPLIELKNKDKELIRTKATAAAEQVARAVEANSALVGEIYLGVSQQASEKVSAALGYSKDGFDRLREVGGDVVNEFNERVRTPVAQEFKKRKEMWGLRVNSARARLNRMAEIYGDATQPMFAVGKDAIAGVTSFAENVGELKTKGTKAAGEFIRAGRERVGKTYETVSDFVITRAVEAWSTAEGLTHSDIAARATLLRARLANISQVARQAGLRAEEAIVFGIAVGEVGVEKAVAALPESKKGKLILAGGLVAGGLATLAVTHPDVFHQMNEMLAQIGQGHFPGSADAASSAAPHISAVPGAEHIGNVPGVETIPPVTPIPGAEALPHVGSFSDFLTHATTIQSGDTVWDIVKGQAAQVGQMWTNDNGVNKGDVAAGIVSKFMEASGQNPTLMHPGDVFSIANLHLQPDQLSVLERTLNTTNAQQYLTDVMPTFEQVVTGG